MELIREWVITIISVIIFITFIEILIPNSDNKKYINLVVGFLLIIVILSPLTNLIKNQINFEEAILNTSNKMNLIAANNQMKNINYSNDEAVIKIYKDEIVNQITNYIEDNSEFIVEIVSAEVEESSDTTDFGMIKNLNITLKEINEKEEADQKIEPVKINVSLDKKNNNTVKAGSISINKEEDIVKRSIANFYSISEENISIYVLKDKQ